MSEGAASPADCALAQMVAIWKQGEAARYDPVLVNMLARHAAALNRIAPGAFEKACAAWAEMHASGARFETAGS